MADQLPDMLTPVTADTVARGLVSAWHKLFGTTPARDSVLVLTSQIRHETGFRSVHAWNLGNFKAIDGDGRDWCVFRAWELERGIKVWRDMRFRAYRSIEEGMVDFLGSLRKRFAAAWPFVLSGDPEGFVHALKAAGYFTDTEENYSRDVVAAFRLYQATLQFETNPPLIDEETRARVEGLVAISLNELATHDTEPAPPPVPDEVPTQPEPKV